MNIFVVFAILSPFFFASMNVYDKYIIERRIKNLYSYWFIVGCISISYSLILAFFLDWSKVTLTDCILPMIIGILYFGQTYFYLRVLQKEDAAPTSGLFHLYPLVVVGLSYIFLHEIISWYGYVGIGLTILGAIFISLRLKKITFLSKKRYIIAMILLIGIGEFIMKIAVSNINVWNAFAITSFVEGTLTFLLIFRKDTRAHLSLESVNIRWILFGEIFTFLAISTIYLAMSGLPASIVAGISAIQILFIVLLERFFDQFIGKISRDHYLLPKLIPMILIFLGLILLTI
jgi:drug/metabolite transporter (DMT)-like permease